MEIKLSSESEKKLRIVAKNAGMTLSHYCEVILIREFPREDFLLTITEAQQIMTIEDIERIKDIYNHRYTVTDQEAKKARELLFIPKLKKNMLIEILNHIPLGEDKNLYQLDSRRTAEYGVMFYKDRLYIANSHPYLVSCFGYMDLFSLPYLSKGTSKWMDNTTRRCVVFDSDMVKRMMGGTDNDAQEIEFI